LFTGLSDKLQNKTDFVNWYLHTMYAVEKDPTLGLFSDEASFRLK